MNNTNERTELIAALRLLAQISGCKLVTQAADMLEDDAHKADRLSNNLAAEKSIYDSAVIKNERLQAEIEALKAQQVAVPLSDAQIESLREKTFNDWINKELMNECNC